MSASFVSENAVELSRLRALVTRLTEADLQRPLTAGWTVAGILGHLAFWDYRALVLIRRWQAEGFGPSPIDIDGVNDATQPLLLAIPPRAAADLCLSAAEAIDSTLAAAPVDLIAGLESLGRSVRLRRCDHWRMHLDEIEAALAAACG